MKNEIFDLEELRSEYESTYLAYFRNRDEYFEFEEWLKVYKGIELNEKIVKQKLVNGLFFILVILSLFSCTSSKISSKPTKREINRAMKYSTSNYYLPRMEISY